MNAKQDIETVEEDLGKLSSVLESQNAESEPMDLQQDTATQTNSETAVASSSSPRRPLTRSQTGTVAKRRKRDDSEDPTAPKKRAPAPRKKEKSGSPSQPLTTNGSPKASASPKPPTTREPSMSSSSASGGLPSETGQLTFCNGDQVESRVPRSRATLPTPIPNLTKKSRGRRVPTQTSGASDSDQKDQRLYVCKVDGCGKCFHRGEHLKRHIRSIHTHEKPFKCTFALCEKYFNRHDNLLQHLKVHRDDVPSRATKQPSVQSERPPSRTTSPQRHQRQSASPPMLHHDRDHDREGSYDEDDERSYNSNVDPRPVPRTIYDVAPAPATYGRMNMDPYPIPFAYSPASRITNMAVSSLRTELPL